MKTNKENFFDIFRKVGKPNNSTLVFSVYLITDNNLNAIC